jgi:hypothetical protein
LTDVVERRARVGIELVDALTGGPVLAASRVSIDGAQVLRATRSRWFVEDDLPALATFLVEAVGYVAETVPVAVPPVGAPGVLVEVPLKPRTGYPFPPALTRVVGLVVFDDTGLPAHNAEVVVTPEHGAVDGAPLATRTTDDGQYAMWFLPALGALSPPIADGYRVDAQLVVGATTFTGSLPAQPLSPNRRNDAPVLRLTP